MNQEAQDLIEQLLKEGERYDDVRRTVISHGYSTEGFKDIYTKIQQELGIEEPPPRQDVTQKRLNDALDEDGKQYTQPQPKKPVQVEVRDTSQLFSNIVKIISAILVLIAAVILLSGYGAELREIFFGAEEYRQELDSGDAVLKGNLLNMQLSANRYGGHMLGYEDVCASIGIDRAIFSCFDNTDAYAIDVSLSDGRYYCVDSTGFSGTLGNSLNGAVSCDR